MEKIKQFAVKHWRILTVACITLISFILILGVVLQMKKSTKKESVEAKVEGKYPITSKTEGDTVITITVDGSCTPDHKWVFEKLNGDYVTLTVGDEKNDKIDLTATAVSKGVAAVELKRVKESDENVISAELEINIIVDQDEDGNLSISLGTSKLMTMSRDITLGEGTKSPATVNVTSVAADIEIVSRLENIQCTVSEEGFVEITGPDTTYETVVGEETGEYMVTDFGEKIPVTNSYRQAVKTNFILHAINDGDVNVSIKSEGIDLDKLQADIDTLKNLETDDDNSAIIEALEKDYAFQKEKIDRDGADAYKGFEYTLKLHIENSVIYVID